VAKARIPKAYLAGQRPVMIGIGINGTGTGLMAVRKIGYLMVTTDQTRNVLFSSPATPTANVGLYLGRATDGDPDTMAVMDVLDLGLNTPYLDPKKMWLVMNALDSIYGVTDS